MPPFGLRYRPAVETLEGRIIPRVDILNLNYAGDGLTSHLLDLHLPDDYQTGQPLPTIVWIHGGGWQSGSKASWGPAMPFVERGYAVASLNYRLSGEAIWPAQIHDVKGAIRWLRTHAAEYHFDPARFATWGSSAGGHLAASAGTMNVTRLEGDIGGNLDQSSQVQAVVDYYGPTDLWQIWQVPGYAGHGEAGSPESKLIGATLKFNPRKAGVASPTTFVTSDDPPTMMAHGTLTDTNGDGIPDGDGVVPWQQTEVLHDLLDNVGIDNVVYYLPGVGHGGPEFTTPLMEQRVADFLSEHLPIPITPPFTGVELRHTATDFELITNSDSGRTVIAANRNAFTAYHRLATADDVTATTPASSARPRLAFGAAAAESDLWQDQFWLGV